MKTILLAAAEPTDHLARAFDAADFAVLVAADGLSAIGLALGRTPDLVIADYHLPDMDGCSVLERIEAIPGCEMVPGVVLMDTTRGRVPGGTVALRCPRATVLTKPVDPVDLLAVVRALTGGAV